MSAAREEDVKNAALWLRVVATAFGEKWAAEVTADGTVPCRIVAVYP